MFKQLEYHNTQRYLSITYILEGNVIHTLSCRGCDFQNEQVFIAVVLEHLVVDFGQYPNHNNDENRRNTVKLRDLTPLDFYGI